MFAHFSVSDIERLQRVEKFFTCLLSNFVDYEEISSSTGASSALREQKRTDVSRKIVRHKNDRLLLVI